MKQAFERSVKLPIEKQPPSYYSKILLALLFLGFIGILSVNAQHQSISNLQDKTLPPFTCNAPIDSSWTSITGKTRSIQPMVRIAYLIPSNRSPQEKGVEALRRIVVTMSEFLRDEMAYNGLSPKTFRYETEADGRTPLIHLVDIPETDVQIESDPWINKINAARNAGLGVWQRGQVWLLVSESHLQQPDGSINAGGALGSSFGNADDPGVATIPSHVLSLIGSEGLTDDREYHGLTFPEIGPYPLQQGVSFFSFDRHTISSIKSVMIGAGWHELMHALGIRPHDFRNDDNFHGNLMGNGFRGIRGYLHQNRYSDDYTRLAFATAHALENNHYFNEGKEHNGLDIISLPPPSNVPQDGKLIFNVSASDADGLSLLRLIGPSALHVERVLSGTSFEGQIATPYFEPGIEADFLIQLYDKQGNKLEKRITVTPMAGSKRSPWPYMLFTPPIGETGDNFSLDAGRSQDRDGNIPLTFEWDFDNDGVFDTPSNQNSTYLAENLSAGNHLIRVRATNSSGMQTISTPMALHVSGEAPPQFDITFTLINADTDEDLFPLTDGMQVDLSRLSTKNLDIRVDTTDDVESVGLSLTGDHSIERTENLLPYALFRDLPIGDYIGHEFEPGNYSLAVTPYTGDRRTGEMGTVEILNFEIVDRSEFSLRINTGGDEVTYDGETFKADAYFDTGRTLDRPRTGLPEPYQSFRFSPSQQMSYDIPVPDGEYIVNLYFAELWFGATDGGLPGAGRRVFDVNIEGELVEDNLDIFAEVGAEAMLVKTHTVTVIGGNLDINFSSLASDGGERHPIINAIEVTKAERPFITTRSTSEKQIAVYADSGVTYDFTVDWGDSSIDTGVSETIVHTYAEDGNYEIAISGNYPRVNIFSNDDQFTGRLVSVDQWGTIKWASMENAFPISYPFEIRADDVPDLSQVKSTRNMFQGGLTINDKIKEWDVSNVTDMRGMFIYTNLNYDLADWDVSNVTQMDGMFNYTALSMENYDITLIGWSDLPSLQTGVVFDGGESLYCLGEEARQKLIDDYGWTITDGGLNCFFGELSVVEFVLVNADTEEDLFTITDGMHIDMRYLPTLNLDIRVETGAKTESVGFELVGTQSIIRGESIPPYALFQDLPIGDYIGHEFDMGRYFLLATPYSENGLKGEAGDVHSISFEFVDSTLTVSGFTLIDAATDTPLFDLADDLYLTLDDIPSLFLDIRANTSDDVESVRLELTGEQSTVRTESLEPYALFRDLPIGDYIGNDFVIGSYTVTATPYSGNNLTGEMGTPLSIDFKILEADPILEVTSFTLIDARADVPLFDLTDGMVIRLDDIPSLFLAIRANTTENVNSVRLDLSGSQSTAYFEMAEPYALGGTSPTGDYFGRNFILGSYTIKAVPYLGNDQDSKMGTPLSVDFEIADTGSSSKQAIRMVIVPNPVAVSTTLTFEKPVQLTEIQVFDVMGRMLNTYNAVEIAVEGGYNLNVNDLKSGTYFIVSKDIKGRRYQKQLAVKK